MEFFFNIFSFPVATTKRGNRKERNEPTDIYYTNPFIIYLELNPEILSTPNYIISFLRWPPETCNIGNKFMAKLSYSQSS